MLKKAGEAVAGWAYTDQYGFSHVTQDKATADKYGQSGSVQEYSGRVVELQSRAGKI